jgi:hypothetical protein
MLGGSSHHMHDARWPRQWHSQSHSLPRAHWALPRAHCALCDVFCVMHKLVLCSGQVTCIHPLHIVCLLPVDGTILSFKRGAYLSRCASCSSSSMSSSPSSLTSLGGMRHITRSARSVKNSSSPSWYNTCRGRGVFCVLIAILYCWIFVHLFQFI